MLSNLLAGPNNSKNLKPELNFDIIMTGHIWGILSRSYGENTISHYGCDTAFEVGFIK